MKQSATEPRVNSNNRSKGLGVRGQGLGSFVGRAAKPLAHSNLLPIRRPVGRAVVGPGAAVFTVLMLGLVASVGVAFASSPVVLVLQHDLVVQRGLQDEELAHLQRVKSKASESWTRVRRGAADFLHAQVQGETIESLRRRDEDLRLVEGQLLMDMLEMQQLRQSTIVRENLMAVTQAELRRLTGGTGPSRDLISGAWQLVMEPGGHNGLMTLTLDGTLIQGTYDLDGGWTGSMRGTLVGGRVRMERIDSQMGFVAIFYGALRVEGDDVRLEGKWEATQLAAGMPSAGGWVAQRLGKEEE